MAATTSDPITERRRMTRRERLGFVLVIVVSLIVALAGLGKAFAATLSFFGEQPTARDNAIASQSLRIALWAIATPVCASSSFGGAAHGRPF